MALGDIIKLYQAQSGANGSFNYGDTSRYGPRELRKATAGGHIIIPGGGGGAKANPTLIFGGRGGPGANPNGVVIIRLTKLE